MSKKKGAIRDYIQAIGVAVLAALILRAFVIQAFRIPSGSMKDTLLIGDFLLVNKFVYGARTPRRIWGTDVEIPSFRMPAIRNPKHGDIVIFKYPKNEKLDYIKRCVGLAGDTITVRNNTVYVNGDPEGTQTFLKREFDHEEGRYVNYYRVEKTNGKKYIIRKYADAHSPKSDFGPVVVPEKHLFMMGDNRDNSSDSRYWGFMPRDNVEGEALVIYFSWDKHEPMWNLLDSVRWDRIFKVIL